MDKQYVCQYCNTGYTREKTLAVHMCEQKRRALQKDEKHVKLGFYAFVRFYQLCQNLQGTKTYEEFCKSPYYNAFVKFGSFVSNVKPLYPEKYIDYVVTSGVKLDHWCRDELYEKYALELIKKEGVETAVERSIKTMMDWADANNASWHHYFKYASLNRITQNLKDGKISPWLVLNRDIPVVGDPPARTTVPVLRHGRAANPPAAPNRPRGSAGPVAAARRRSRGVRSGRRSANLVLGDRGRPSSRASR